MKSLMLLFALATLISPSQSPEKHRVEWSPVTARQKKKKEKEKTKVLKMVEQKITYITKEPSGCTPSLR